jgi:hypothetical protein
MERRKYVKFNQIKFTKSKDNLMKIYNGINLDDYNVYSLSYPLFY